MFYLWFFMIPYTVCLFVFVFQTGPHEAQGSLKLTMLSKMPLHFWYHCFHLTHAGITGISHHDPAPCPLSNRGLENLLFNFLLLILQIKVQHVILKSNRKKWKDNQDKNFNTLCRMSPATQVRVNEDRPAQRAVEMSLGMQAVGRQASALHLVRHPA